MTLLSVFLCMCVCVCAWSCACRHRLRVRMSIYYFYFLFFTCSWSEKLLKLPFGVVLQLKPCTCCSYSEIPPLGWTKNSDNVIFFQHEYSVKNKMEIWKKINQKKVWSWYRLFWYIRYMLNVSFKSILKKMHLFLHAWPCPDT